jgi:hypothetical protein
VAGGFYILIAFCFGVATAVVGRSKGSSGFVWFLIGAALPLLGLIAAVLYRVERTEPERRCPRCGAVQKIYVQVCGRCGEDLYLPEPSEVRPGRGRA